ncbi:MAG: YggS family pyridoxal phosphate-dependent enzyme [Acidimicrobiia bacterium]|nr:YggS family pyridoxal phosphate-dependent enzyme [Acidimicrobiia bacterium]
MAIGLRSVQESIVAAAKRAGVDPSGISLIAVSKQQSDESLLAAYDEGQRRFGENRQQALAARIDRGLPDDIEWHFIGRLQRRKVQSVATHAVLVQSFDRLELIPTWPHDGPPVLLQFNIGEEPQKGGFRAEEAEAVAAQVRDAGIEVVGVMAIPPFEREPERSRPHFAALRAVFDRLASDDPLITVCSMGMSNDYPVAIEEGATMVRVGTAVFGPRS